MAQYRKKPIVIESEQFFVNSYRESAFLTDAVSDRANASELWFGKSAGEGRYFIQTLEGAMMVSEGDWVIKGVQGEFYPCKPEIFESTYELVEHSEEVEEEIYTGDCVLVSKVVKYDND